VRQQRRNGSKISPGAVGPALLTLVLYYFVQNIQLTVRKVKCPEDEGAGRCLQSVFPDKVPKADGFMLKRPAEWKERPDK
jgi:hypothetical protein